MEKSISEMQREFALQQMVLENPKKVVIIKRKRVTTSPKRRIVKRIIVKTEEQQKAEDAQLALMLDAYSKAMEIHNARKDVFDLNVSASLSEIAGFGVKESDEERFVKFMIKERAERLAWIESQNFPEFERTEQDDEDDSRERLAFKIYKMHQNK